MPAMAFCLFLRIWQCNTHLRLVVLSLFVVNGQILGGGRRAASNFVPVNDIQSIRVLKNPSETGIYGVQGANGVIEIQLKKTEPVTTVTTSIPVFSEI